MLQDILTLHGRQFRNADVIVASPPCQAYSYMAMPWSRAKAQAAEIRADETGAKLAGLTALFDACFRIQREASEAAGRYIPLVVENVKGAQPWVGRAAWHYGSFYLWGDVPALMPITGRRSAMKDGVTHRSNGATNFHGAHTKNNGGSWFGVAHNTGSGVGQNPVNGVKVPGIKLSEVGFNVAAAQRHREGVKHNGDWFSGYGGGFGWDHSQMRQYSSKSDSRKAVSARIAKIPFPLAHHIATVFRPDRMAL